VGLLGLGTLGLSWASAGFDLTHNTVNFLLLAVGLTIHGSPVSYARAIAGSVRGTSGIILQFPFYGGVMGLMEGSGLGKAIAETFVHLADARTLPFFTYLASIMTQLFVPSGGGEWAVEGPVMLEAAKRLGAPLGKTCMGVAYGNMVGNLFQPFWAIPLLAVLGLTAREIMGYCLVIFLFAFPILGLALLV
jgi:short-chain fatty acids transporter